MKEIYFLRINKKGIDANKISKILKLDSNKSDDIFWIYEMSFRKNEKQVDFISLIYRRLKNKFESLRKLNITKGDVSLWYLYEYDGQCNIELTKKELKRLGELEITFCISCWQK